jgi:lipopolysaccharide heptosyltransferase II
VFDYLQIYRRRERLAVGLADVGLRVLAAPFRRRPANGVSSLDPARVLVLRLERIGDLLMAFGALAELRTRLPGAHINLVVGSWNESLARAMRVADAVECLDAPWLSRSAPRPSRRLLVARALGWHKRRYDLAINLEPDIRSNLLLGCSRADRRVGFYAAGGGAVLTHAAAYDPKAHTNENASRLVRLALGDPSGGVPGTAVAGAEASRRAGTLPRLQLPEAARDRARQLLAPASGSPCIGLHASGGRSLKQWHPDRFAEAATALGREYRATIVLTGTEDEREIVRRVRDGIRSGVRVIDLCGNADLLDMAAVLEQLLVFVTGDTGPMHVAAAVGTPVVAVFGPSDPARYAPLTPTGRIVRVDLPCSPCNRIRHPPARCAGHVPDCLEGVAVEQVVAAARDLIGHRVTLGHAR